MASNSRGEDANDSDDGGGALLETIYRDGDLPESDQEMPTAEDEAFMHENGGHQPGHAQAEAGSWSALVVAQ